MHRCCCDKKYPRRANKIREVQEHRIDSFETLHKSLVVNLWMPLLEWKTDSLKHSTAVERIESSTRAPSRRHIWITKLWMAKQQAHTQQTNEQQSIAVDARHKTDAKKMLFSVATAPWNLSSKKENTLGLVNNIMPARQFFVFALTPERILCTNPQPHFYEAGHRTVCFIAGQK